ncbi:MAG: HmuY family protein [Candidatus Hatepunaea meridiana]|nr:HmuY family protein [Candidatus Hatepunaea meridiana]
MRKYLTLILSFVLMSAFIIGCSDDDDSSPTGLTSEPNISVSPANLEFGTVQVGESAELDLTISNGGDADLVIFDISTTGDYFSDDFTAEVTVTPNSNSIVTVSFAPESGGEFSGSLTITSNDPDNETVTVTLTGTSSTGIITGDLTVDATSYTDWVYFSFSQGAVITVEAPMTSNAWDLGLLRNHFRTNSGTSGNGQGGVYDAGVVNFASITEAPADGYAADDSIEVIDQNSMPPEYIWIPGSSVLDEAFVMSGGMPPSIDPTNHIYIIRTGDGKYAKVWFKNYYNVEGNSGHISIQYAYQSDDGRSLE